MGIRINYRGPSVSEFRDFLKEKYAAERRLLQTYFINYKIAPERFVNLKIREKQLEGIIKEL